MWTACVCSQFEEGICHCRRCCHNYSSGVTLIACRADFLLEGICGTYERYLSLNLLLKTINNIIRPN